MCWDAWQEIADGHNATEKKEYSYTKKINIGSDGKCMFTSPLHSTRQNTLYVSAT